MKNTLLTTASAGLAAFGIAVMPVLADDATPPPVKPAAEEAAENTATLYIILVSGAG